MDTKIPPLHISIGFLQKEFERLDNMTQDRITCSIPYGLKTALENNYEDMVAELQKGTSIEEVFQKNGVGIDDQAAVGFGCTDNCSCEKSSSMEDLMFIEERLSALQRQVQ